MKDSVLVLAICLTVGAVLSKEVPPATCEEVKDGICGKGEYAVHEGDFGYRCAGCPENTFMDLDRHDCQSCKKHTQTSPGEMILKPGDSTADNVFVCKSGFFKAQSSSNDDEAGCRPCSVCREGTRTALKCGLHHDTVCCLKGMDAGLDYRDGSFHCVALEQELSGQVANFRIVRSPDQTQDGASSRTADSKGNIRYPNIGLTDDDSRSSTVPARTAFSKEEDDDEVEFPVWARILCAGVVVGIFLFYMGIGIPCNLCGTRDKLRALRKMMQGHDQEITVEPSKEKVVDEKPKPTTDQV